MESLKLSENELRFFNELFGVCDVENSGKVSGPKATELFRTSQLSHDVLHQITELCGAKRLGHFGRSQFFLACKLISAAQIGLPLKLETFTTVETPLPKFTRASEIDRWQQQQPLAQPAHQPTGKTRQNLIHLQDQESGNQIPGQLPPPPTKSRPNLPGNHTASQRPPSLFDDTDPKFTQQGYGISKAGSPPPPQPLLPEPNVINRFGGLTSPGHSDLSPPPPPPPPSSATILPTTLTSMDKDWATYVAPNHGHQALVEGHQWQQFEDDRQLLTTEDETSERHSSDDDECIYVITDEQREYYTNQFKTMQPNLSGQISGAVAKEFFEKSKLPLQELSKIWQLSDVNKDGALSLEEFCTAMHLVVLRRNNITLPDVLPPPLVPQINRLTFEAVTESGHPTVAKAVASPRRSPTEPTSPQSKEWTRFNDSPTSSVLSSPGIKPVNFDFQKSSVEQDPKILHPVPVRLSPESHLTSSDDGEAPKSTPPIQDQNQYELLRDHQRSPSKKAGESQNQVVAIQRPVVKKSSVSGPGSLPPPPTTVQANNCVAEDSTIPNPARDQRSGSFSGPMSCYPHGSLLPLGTSGPGPKKEPPPPPPPRPKRNHARSSSLDLNRLVTGRGSLSGPQSQSAQLGAPPAVPPRMSPSATTPKKLVGQKSETDAAQISSEQAQANFADFTQFSQHRLPDETNSSEVPQLKTGAFEVYRRPSDPIQGGGAISSTIVTTTTTTNNNASNTQTTAPKVPPDQGAMKSDTSNSVTVNNNSVIGGHAPTSTLIETKHKVPHTGKLRDKKEMHTWLRSQKERNMALCRLNSELNQELSEVMEERIALEIQLEHLKPYSN